MMDRWGNSSIQSVEGRGFRSTIVHVAKESDTNDSQSSKVMASSQTTTEFGPSRDRVGSEDLGGRPDSDRRCRGNYLIVLGSGVLSQGKSHRGASLGMDGFFFSRLAGSRPALRESPAFFRNRPMFFS